MQNLPPLERYSTLLAALEQESLTNDALLQRDRAIGQRCSAKKPLQQLDYWLSETQQNHSNTAALHSSHFILVLLSVVLGFTFAQLALNYQGNAPVNVFQVWILLAGLPLLTLFVWLLTQLPFRILGVSSYVESVQSLMLKPWLKRFSQPFTTSGAALNFERPLIVAYLSRASQLFALSAGIGVLLSLMWLFVSRDYAFGWSTTLTITASTIHQVTSWISTPFQALWPAAVPSIELIDLSQFYRLNNRDNAAALDASALTQWWPFILASVACYNVLPRLFTLAWANRQLRKQTQQLTLVQPLIVQLLNRLNSPLVQTAAVTDRTESEIEHVPTSNKSTFQLEDKAIDLLIYGHWSSPESLIQQVKDLGADVQQLVYAGGRATFQQDIEVAVQLHKSQTDMILIAVKGWEPPMLDFLDVVETLCSHAKRDVLIALVAFEQQPLLPRDISAWTQAVKQLNQANLYCEQLK